MQGYAHAAIGACAGLMAASSPLAVAAGAFGALLPDIDSDRSLLGRHVHLPVAHHRITHTVWALIAVFVVVHALVGGATASVWLYGVVWGYLSHLVADSFGRAGVVWVWPAKDYISYPSGAYVAPGHKFKLYRNGESSQWVVAAVICVAELVLSFIGRDVTLACALMV